MTPGTESNAEPHPDGQSSWALVRVHTLAATLVVIEFLMMQIIAILITTALYWQLPLIDPEIKRDVNHWMRIFQITSPTMTLSGGVAIVLSSYVFTRPLREEVRRERARANAAEAALAEARTELEAQRRADAEARATAEEQRRIEAEQQRIEAEDRAAAAQAALATLQNDIVELKAMLTDRPARRRRRSLR